VATEINQTKFFMTKHITKDNLFKPSVSRSVTKADLTDNAARAIVETEAANRREKSDRLRARRLALANEKA
jgi:hypothetical protein